MALTPVRVTGKYLSTDGRSTVDPTKLSALPPVKLPGEQYVYPVAAKLRGDGEFLLPLFADSATPLIYALTETLGGSTRTVSVTVPAGASGELKLADLAGYSQPPGATLDGAGDLSLATLRAAFGTPVERAVLATGRKVGYLGDSFTVGAGASNVVFAYVTRSQIAAGTAYVDNTSPVNAVGGRTSAQALAALPDLLALNPDAVFLLIGTNDSSATHAVPVATFADNVTAIHDQARAAGKPLVVGTVPPRAASASAAERARIDGYNTWLRLWAPSAGVRLVDAYAALADPATGALRATYNTANGDGTGGAGDGVHPNNAGHLALGIAVGTVLADLAGPLPLPAFPSEGNLVKNPLMAGAGTEATDWFGLAGSATTTYALEADTTGRLPYGRWQSMTLTSEGFRQFVTECKTPGRIAAGDELLLTAYLNVVDLGGWVANPGNGKIAIFDQDVFLKTNPIDDPRMLQPGPIMYRYTAPAGMTGAFIGLVGDVPAGVSAKYQIGAVCLYNLTALGLAGVV